MRARVALMAARAATLAGIATLGAGFVADPGFSAADPQSTPPMRRPAEPGLANADSVTIEVVQAAPFRPDRRPHQRRYDPVPQTPGNVAEATPPPKPFPVITGIAWGSTPVVVLEGIPGAESGRVLGEGDTLGGLRVRRISRQVVTLVGYDTTWTLDVRTPWQ